MRKPIIAGNWKMNTTAQEAVQLVEALKGSLNGDIYSSVDVVVCPPTISLSTVKQTVEGSSIGVGAQNMYWEESGAYTGEIAANMLTSIGIQYCIIGHSERRAIFHETNEMVNKKVKKAIASNLTPIMCVGETLEERESEKTFDVIKDHVVNGLAGVSADDAKKMVIAYEPVWAIGTGKTATPDQAQEVHAYIRNLLTELYDEQTAQAIRLQYGGSVKPDNIKELISQQDIDGALVGGASLKADSFSAIVEGGKQG